MRIIRAGYASAVLAWLFYTILDPWIPMEELPAGAPGMDAFICYMLVQFSSGVMVAGLPLGLWYRLRRDQARDRVLETAVAVSLGLAAAGVGLLLMTVLSMGYILLEPAVVAGTIAAGAGLGLLYASPPPRSASIGGFLAGLAVAVVLGSFLGGLILGIAMAVPVLFATASSWSGPVFWLLGSTAVVVVWRAGRRPLAIGIGMGLLEMGFLFMGNS